MNLLLRPYVLWKKKYKSRNQDIFPIKYILHCLVASWGDIGEYKSH